MPAKPLKKLLGSDYLQDALDAQHTRAALNHSIRHALAIVALMVVASGKPGAYTHFVAIASS